MSIITINKSITGSNQYYYYHNTQFSLKKYLNLNMLAVQTHKGDVFSNADQMSFQNSHI
jgi:hypothetical protein